MRQGRIAARTQRVARIVVTFVLTAGLVLTAATPARADPYWVVLDNANPPAGATCGFEDQVTIGVLQRACVVVNGGYTQALVQIKNFSNGAITIEAPNIRLWIDGERIYDRSCNRSTLNRGFVVACFGPTLYRPCRHVQAQTLTIFNDDRPRGVWLWSPTVRTNCA